MTGPVSGNRLVDDESRAGIGPFYDHPNEASIPYMSRGVFLFFKTARERGLSACRDEHPATNPGW
jgi:hypothetical protein